MSGKLTSSKVIALHSFLYCIESGKNTEPIVSYLINFLVVTFQDINTYVVAVPALVCAAAIRL